MSGKIFYRIEIEPFWSSAILSANTLNISKNIQIKVFQVHSPQIEKNV